MLIYLDICCFNRPYDDQVQPLIRLETEAKLLIQGEIIKRNLDLVWSFILRYENNDNPFKDKRNRISAWESIATKRIAPSQNVLELTKDLMKLGIRTKDATHLACAIFADAAYFVTTDKKLLNKNVKGITIINPLEFVRGFFDAH